MKASTLIVGFVGASFLASLAGAQVLVTDGLVSLHVANAGWNGTTWTDQILGDGYDPTGTLIGDVTYVRRDPIGIPHFKIDDVGPGSDPPVSPAPNNQIEFDMNLTQFGTSDFTYQLVINNTPENAYFAEHSGAVGAGTGVSRVSDTCCETEGFGIWLIRSGNPVAASSLSAHVRHFNVRPRVPTVQIVTSPNQTPGPNNKEVSHSLFDGTWRTLTVVRKAHELLMYFDGEEVVGDWDEAQNFPPPRQGAVDLGGGREDIPDSTLNIGGHGFAAEGDGFPGAKIHATLFYDRALSIEEIGLNAAYFPIPEPTSFALLTMGALVMLKRRR